MADSFDFTFTNPNAATASLELLSAVTANSQKSTKFRAITPYVATYDAGTTIIFRTTVNENAYTINAPATPTEILAYFNTLNVGTFILFASNAIDGNIFDVISPYPYTELEINSTVVIFFNIGTGFDGIVNCILIQPDNKILAGGFFTAYNTTLQNFITRINIDGSIDTGFNIGTGFDSQVTTIALQTDNKIIVGGFFTSYNGNPCNYIARLNPDGSFDSTFNIGIGFDAPVQTIYIQSDNKLLVGGIFNSYDGTSSNFMIRLNNDGTIDTPAYLTGFNDLVRTIAIQTDNKIIIGGAFTSYAGFSCGYIVRLNNDLTPDIITPLNIFSNSVFKICIQPDNKIIIGGDFTSYDVNDANFIIRLNPDGTIDSTFNYGGGTGFNSTVVAIIVQLDGKIVVGGDFGFYDPIFTNRIIRLNSDGSIDSSFNYGDGVDLAILDIRLQSDNKIILAGRFNTYNFQVANSIIRINQDGSSNTISL